MKEMLTNYHRIISSQILKNNREDVDYESIINNIFTTYLLILKYHIRNICIFAKLFIVYHQWNY